MIVDGLSMASDKKMNDNIDEVNQTTNVNEGIVSTTMLQMLSQLNETYEEDITEYDRSNEVVTGLTTHGKFIIANIIDKCSQIAITNFVSVIMGLTATGQIINGGDCCISDLIIPKSVETKCEQTLISDENNATIFTVIGNLTEKNEKIVVGLTSSNLTNISI